MDSIDQIAIIDVASGCGPGKKIQSYRDQIPTYSDQNITYRYLQ
jgi:hypothetical protein